MLLIIIELLDVDNSLIQKDTIHQPNQSDHIQHTVRDLNVDFVSDNVVEDSQDTLSLLDLYVSEIDTTLDKNRIKDKLKSLYIEAGDLEL